MGLLQVLVHLHTLPYLTGSTIHFPC
uniref:Uncharacterized protein n=1 Tax=Anguilla anguilla TaxID=7936 RepID=A0A0E9T4X1_ANGAN